MATLLNGFFGLLLVSTVTLGFEVQGLSFKEDPNECSFYIKESKDRGCSDQDYLIAFGFKYCEKFTRHEAWFSEIGQRWLQEARTCLINDIKAMPSNWSCSEVEKAAFNSHQHCYLDAGFCNISLGDRKRAMAIIGTGLLERHVLKGLIQVQLECFRRTGRWVN